VEQTRFASWLSLLASSGTLICCALPALLVALGAGAVLSSLVATVPQLVWLSEHKLAVFGVAALILAVAGAAQWHARGQPCPADATQAHACLRARRASLWIYAGSVAIYVTGGVFAFAL
jgi:hypothetical protein